MTIVERSLGSWLVGALAAHLLLSPVVRADPPAARAHHLEPPPAPEDREPVLAVEFHVAALAPVANEPLCPGTSRCVFGGGGGVGGSFEQRFANGLAIGLGYDILFVDAAGVYEIGVMQLIRAAIRYVFLPRQLVHPVIDLGVGALVFGDSFRVATAGGAVQLGIGGEIEVTHAIGFTAMLVTRAFSTAAFTTATDGTARADGVAVNAALALQLGIVILDP